MNAINLIVKSRIGGVIKIEAPDKILVMGLFLDIGVKFQKILQLTFQLLAKLWVKKIFEFEAGEVEFSACQGSPLPVVSDRFSLDAPA